MRRMLLGTKCWPGPEGTRLGLQVSLCGHGNRPWRPEVDGSRWSTASYGLVQLVDGGGYCETERCRRLAMRPGDLVQLSPQGWHYYGPWRNGSWPERCVFFEGRAAAAIVAGLGWTSRRPLLRPSDPVAVQTIMDALIEAAHAAREQDLVPLLLDLLLELETAEALGSKEGRARPGLWELIDAMRDDPTQPWLPEAEARRMGISASTLRRDFATLLGVPPERYLSEQRIRLACTYMREGRSIAAAGAAVGFDDPAHFSRRFKQITGQAPRLWLSQHARD